MSGLPTSVERALLDRVERLVGRAPRVLGVRRLAGGCINSASQVQLDTGDDVFVKWNDDGPPDLFEAEAQGLEALAAATNLRVPSVLGVGRRSGKHPGWLALEYVPAGRPGADYHSILGEGLAQLHRSASAHDLPYGWPRDNYVGSLPQSNAPNQDWPAFWRESRLAPQVELVKGRLTSDDLDAFERLFHDLEGILAYAGAEGPALLHGDLWSGNVYAGTDGAPVLVDPAVYRGHREVDLAMTELFGGFSAAFYEAYAGDWPLIPGYSEPRRAVYQLYPLLVHVNLFGSGYLAAMRRALISATSPP